MSHWNIISNIPFVTNHLPLCYEIRINMLKNTKNGTEICREQSPMMILFHQLLSNCCHGPLIQKSMHPLAQIHEDTCPEFHGSD